MGPLAGLRLALVGPGRVGASLGHWSVASGGRLELVAGASADAARALAERLGASATATGSLSSAGLDLLLVAVPTAVLPRVVDVLAARPQASVALHTAGSCGAEVLAPLRRRGTAVGSLHPLRAFPDVTHEVAAAVGTFFALDGDPEAQRLAARLVAAWGGEPAPVPGSLRPLYHLAASLAAGGVVTLLSLADEIARRIGLPPAALAGYFSLARGALTAAELTEPPAAALTGPVARGESELLATELELLGSTLPEALPAVRELARETLRQRSRAQPLDHAQVALLEALGGRSEDG